MDVKTDFSSSVHFGRLAVQLWQNHLDWSRWVGRWDLELEVELVLDQLVDVPALAFPFYATVVRFNTKPFIVIVLVDFNICYQGRVLFS